MLENTISRRKMLGMIKGSAAVLACVAIAPRILTGCKGQTSQQKPSSLESLPAGCPNSENLSQEIISRRKLLNYVDLSPIPTRNCNNCKLYTTSTTSHCGGCLVLPGPVHPKGYCSSWYYRM